MSVQTPEKYNDFVVTGSGFVPVYLRESFGLGFDSLDKLVADVLSQPGSPDRRIHPVTGLWTDIYSKDINPVSKYVAVNVTQSEVDDPNQDGDIVSIVFLDASWPDMDIGKVGIFLPRPWRTDSEEASGITIKEVYTGSDPVTQKFEHSQYGIDFMLRAEDAIERFMKYAPPRVAD